MENKNIIKDLRPEDIENLIDFCNSSAYSGERWCFHNEFEQTIRARKIIDAINAGLKTKGKLQI
jgi:hypothetical protein